jgi:hypothetical protein
LENQTTYNRFVSNNRIIALLPIVIKLDEKGEEK